MSENSNEREEQVIQEEQVQAKVDLPESEKIETAEEVSTPDAVTSDDATDTQKASKKKLSKKQLGIIGAIAAVIVIVVAIVLIPSKFERVKNECVHIAGQAGTGKNYFSLDTDPYENMDETMRAFSLPDTQKKTLEAIKYANDELGFPGSVYSDMMKTTALMGRQSEENGKYKVSWTYHPDHGLEVTYTKK